VTDHDADLETIDLSPPPPTAPPPPPVPGSGGGSPDWPEPPAPRHHMTAAVVALVVVMLAAGIGAFAITAHIQNNSDNTTADSPRIVPNSPSTDPDESVLTRLGVQQVDVSPDYSVQVIRSGDEVTGTVTLDLCNGTYPSETLRTARLQVIEVDAFFNGMLSTEAVLYRNPAATVQAFNELRDVSRKCPHRPVASPNGGRTLTTTFNAAPDGAWPRRAGVERLAYDIDTVDQKGTTDHSIAVYLRRGRVLLGVYFPKPDGAQPPVARNTSVQSIVQLFQSRLAALPDSVVNRG
jgi:hypothetical protein